jgi:hypothetical protein
MGEMTAQAGAASSKAQGERDLPGTPGPVELRKPVPDEEMVDRHLGAVLDGVITAIQETKQAVWSASRVERQRAFAELRTFLATQAAAVAEAEQRIGGRDPLLLSPTGHRIVNLRAEARGDDESMAALLFTHLRALVADVRARAAEIDGSPEARLFTELANGIEHRVRGLEGTN